MSIGAIACPGAEHSLGRVRTDASIHYSAFYCIALHCIVLYSYIEKEEEEGLVWYGMVWFNQMIIVWNGASHIWYGHESNMVWARVKQPVTCTTISHCPPMTCIFHNYDTGTGLKTCRTVDTVCVDRVGWKGGLKGCNNRVCWKGGLRGCVERVCWKLC